MGQRISKRMEYASGTIPVDATYRYCTPLERGDLYMQVVGEVLQEIERVNNIRSGIVDKESSTLKLHLSPSAGFDALDSPIRDLMVVAEKDLEGDKKESALLYFGRAIHIDEVEEVMASLVGEGYRVS